MRVGTLFERQTADFLAEHFVLVTHNQLPELYCTGQKVDATAPYPAAQQANAREGAGGGNVRSYFCSFDGKIVHYVAGRWTPERYAQEARWALARLEADVPSLAKAHRAALVALKQERDVVVPPRELERLATQAAQPQTGGSKAALPAEAVSRLYQAAAFNRLIRSREEVLSFLREEVRTVLQRVEDEVYTKGAVGCDF